MDKIALSDYDVKMSFALGNYSCSSRFSRVLTGHFMGFGKQIFKFVLTTTLVVGLAASPALAATKKKNSSAPNNRYASIVMDAETGQILSQSNPDKQLYPASLTKIMTLLLTFEAIENGQLSLRDRVPMTQRAVNMSPSKIGLPVGASMRVEDAIYSLVTKSANDVAVALAEKVGGSEPRFATMMTRKAREIGMNSTRFVNASGWHDPSQVSSARDMAILARYVIYRYPQYYHYFGTKNFTFQGRNYHNHNRLMSEYAGMDGMKTGYVAASGFNLVASAKRGNKRLIGVVFGGRSTASRNAHMASLLDKGFRGEAVTQDMLVSQGVPVLAKPPIPGRKPVVENQLAMATAPVAAPAAVVQTTQTTSVTTTVQTIAPAAGTGATAPVVATTERYAATLQTGAFGEMAGEGDFDPAETKRLETGLMAIAAVKDEPFTPTIRSNTTIVNDIPDADRPWAIQIGAFTSRVQTDKAIRAAINVLPSSLTTTAQPVIVPLKTADGWMFRGRLSGYTKEQAASACARLRECLTVSPDAAR